MSNTLRLFLILLVIAVIFAVICTDYAVHGGATWWSHVVFWPAMVYVIVTVLATWLRKGSSW